MGRTTERKTERLAMTRVTPAFRARLDAFLETHVEPSDKRGGGETGPTGESDVIRLALEDYLLKIERGEVTLSESDQDSLSLWRPMARHYPAVAAGCARLAQVALDDPECAAKLGVLLESLADLAEKAQQEDGKIRPR